MPKAVIVGGAGQIGLATAQRFLDLGWDVTITGRTLQVLPDGLLHAVCDPRDAEGLSGLVGAGADLLMSCVAFDAVDADCLLHAGRKAARILAVSSASVYCDTHGRTLDEARQCGFPDFPIPITAHCPTVDPGDANYSTRKIAMERALLMGGVDRVTILRPCAIHGPYSRHARECWFVKRLLDGCETISLAYHGESRFQATSTRAIADAVIDASRNVLPPIVNVSDGDSPSVAEIGRTIMRFMGVEAPLIGLPDQVFPALHGVTPWSVLRPMICDSVISTRDVYADAVVPALEWLTTHVDRNNWQDHLPQLAAYPNDQFDYASDLEALKMGGAVELTA